MPPTGSPFLMTIVVIDASPPPARSSCRLELSPPPFLRTTSRTIATTTTPTPSTTRMVEFIACSFARAQAEPARDGSAAGRGHGSVARERAGGGRWARPKAISRPPPAAKERGGRGGAPACAEAAAAARGEPLGEPDDRVAAGVVAEQQRAEQEKQRNRGDQRSRASPRNASALRRLALRGFASWRACRCRRRRCWARRSCLRCREQEGHDDADAEDDAEDDRHHPVEAAAGASGRGFGRRSRLRFAGVVAAQGPLGRCVTPSSSRQLALKADSAAATSASGSASARWASISERPSAAWSTSASSWTRKYSLPGPSPIP